MVRLITVEPFGESWAVRSDEIANEMVFRSGREAEAAAKRLGERLAQAGDFAEIRVHIRGGDLAGRFVCAPPADLAASRSLEPA